MQDHSDVISHRLTIGRHQVRNTLHLLAEGASIPFIARYRKEATDSLDEVTITEIRDQAERLAILEKRRSAIIASLKSNKVLNNALLDQLNSAETISVLEDVYLPYKPKRKTKASRAREKGLQPLAEQLLRHPHESIKIDTFIAAKHDINTEDEALAGARDIIAEIINEDRQTRAELRKTFENKGIVRSRLVASKKETGIKFKDYFDWQESVSQIAGHRLLAIFRGEAEGVLRVSIRPDDNICLEKLNRRYLKKSYYSNHVQLAIHDGYKRLLSPSLETELRKKIKEQAEYEAIAVFARNLRDLLLASPLGAQRVLAIDPGFRTGAKIACLDVDGSFLESTTIYPTKGQEQHIQASKTIINLVERFGIEAIAIGNGTASRETEQFVRGVPLNPTPIITLVNEDGASIYSASACARQEFPELDITIRGAISIGRRLQDPLAELVKIDPKAIGVGQYQHDVDQAALKQSLNETVSSCVNHVGVELNTASMEILAYVSGLGPALAKNIIDYRQANGPFKSLQELIKVPRFGKKAFELAAGFLRINDAENPLDRSAVHPERYQLVQQMAKDCKTAVEMLMSDAKLRKQINLKKYVSAEIGLPTLKDIIQELEKPGRDPRVDFQPFAFSDSIHSLDDLEVGMKLPAIITNVTNFGAFADIGIHQDGLIHISQLADRYVKDPSEIVTVQQRVMVRVITIDTERKRIGLSLKTQDDLQKH